MAARHMARKSSYLALLILCAATWFLIGAGAANAYDPFSSLIPQIPALRDTIESDFPGAAIPSYPFLHMPKFGGEVKVTPIFYNVVKGTFSSPQDGIVLDFTKDLGFVDQASLVEFSGRLQFSRLSLRAYYDAYYRTLRGANSSYFAWPEFRAGVDLDLIQRPNGRFGFDMDFNWKRPSVIVADPQFGPFSVEGPRPVTFGVHGTYNPEGIPVVSPTLEVRYRWPIRTGTKIYEFEAAAGLKLPRTGLGESGLRFGWRRTAIEFDFRGRSADVVLSGFFGEYVFYY